MLVLEIDKVRPRIVPILHPYLSERKKERRKNRHNFIGWEDHAGISYGGVEIVGTRRAVAHQLPWLSGN